LTYKLCRRAFGWAIINQRANRESVQNNTHATRRVFLVTATADRVEVFAVQLL
jgi:hypothetical protein